MAVPQRRFLAALLLPAALLSGIVRLAAAASAGSQAASALRVLALGDSITQGVVPSKGTVHPYTWEFQKRLQSGLGRPVDVVNAGVGGAGVFAVGFNNPTTLVPHAKKMLARRPKYDWVICMAGINDILRVGKSADEVMKGLDAIYKPALSGGSNLLAIVPLPAPGFVSKSDYKEGQRHKMNALIHAAAKAWKAQHPKGPLFLVLNLAAGGPLDFWKMDGKQRSELLDDGLHLTQQGYDKMGDAIASQLLRTLKK